MSTQFVRSGRGVLTAGVLLGASMGLPLAALGGSVGYAFAQDTTTQSSDVGCTALPSADVNGDSFALPTSCSTSGVAAIAPDQVPDITDGQ